VRQKTGVKRHILITGLPGTGKTTMILSLVERLSGTKAGFITKEKRDEGKRTGFVIETISPSGEKKTAPLAARSQKGMPRVGSYRVFVDSIENVAVPSISEEADFIVIDEIGKMECTSNRFKEAVLSAMGGRGRVIATIAKKGVGFIKEVKDRGDVRIFEVTNRNRDSLLETLIREIERG
jgi:nucleoside-triphosphatase THEP1